MPWASTLQAAMVHASRTWTYSQTRCMVMSLSNISRCEGGGVSHGEIRRLRKPTSLRCTGRKTSALRCPLHFYLTLLCHLVELRAVLARIMPPRRPSYVPSFVQDCPHPKYSPHASRHRGELSSTAIPARFHPPRLRRPPRLHSPPYILRPWYIP